MKITYELDLNTFEAWSGAVNTLDKIKNADMIETFESILDDIFPEGCTETELNDYLWFDADQIFEDLGMTEETEEE